jgi:hypothetical protein
MTRKRRRQVVSTLLSLSLALLARTALAQDCSQCIQLICGSSCTFIDPVTLLVETSTCGSNEFNVCVEPDTFLPCSACPQCPAPRTECLNGNTVSTCPTLPPSICSPTGSTLVLAPLASSSGQLASFLDATGATTGKPAGQSIFYRATDGRVHHIYSNTTWFADDPVGATGAPPAVPGSSIATFLDPFGATTGGPAGQSFFYVAADGHVHHVYSNTTWFADDPSAATGATAADPSGGVTAFLDPSGVTTGRHAGQAVFYIGVDQHVHHLFSDTTWHTDDPTAGAGAPLAAVGSSLCSFLDAGGKTTGSPGQAIFYIGTDHHIHHLYSNTTWHTDDPTAMTGAPPAIAGSPLTCFLDPSGKTTGSPAGQSIFYIGTDLHVHHLYSNTTWLADDPTAMTGAPLAAAGSSLTSFLDLTGATTGGVPGQAIFYVGADQQVHHIFSDTTWHRDDPAAATGATPAIAGSPLSSFVDPTGATTGRPSGQAVFYTGTDHHIHHLYSDTTWHTDDPTAMTGAPPAN